LFRGRLGHVNHCVTMTFAIEYIPLQIEDWFQ